MTKWKRLPNRLNTNTYEINNKIIFQKDLNLMHFNANILAKIYYSQNKKIL